MSKPRNAAALAGALAVVLGFTATSVLTGCGAGDPGPYRTVVPAPSPMVSVPADVHAEPPTPGQDYVAVPAPVADPVSPTPDPEAVPEPDTGLSATQNPAEDAPGSGTSAAPGSAAAGGTAPVANAEQVALASRTAWNPAGRDRVAAALAAADAYTAAHPGTAEAAVYSSVRAGLACGSAEDSTALVTRALRSAGYTFTGCGPEDILSWFTGHPEYAAVLPDDSSARPGSLAVVRGPSGRAVIGVYLSDGLAVFGGDAAAVCTVSGSVQAPAVHPVIAPADLFRTLQLPVGTAVEEAPVYIRPVPFA